MTTPVERITERILEVAFAYSGIQAEPETPLLGEGLLDSFQMIELLDVVEREFRIRIRPEDFQDDRLGCARSIAELVASRQKPE